MNAEREEPALFYGVGYGASRRTVVRSCASFCGWFLTAEVGEVRPPR